MDISSEQYNHFNSRTSMCFKSDIHKALIVVNNVVFEPEQKPVLF